MRTLGRIAAFLLCAAAAFAQWDYERHVIFSTSHSDGDYYHGRGSAVQPSTLDLREGKLPVETANCFTPPNCLRLQWRSGFGGTWHATLNVKKHWGSLDPRGSTLAFWMYSDTPLDTNNSPQIRLADEAGHGTPTIRILDRGRTLPARNWTQVRLPLSAFVSTVRSTDEPKLDKQKIASVTIVQGLDDNQPHTVLLDEMEIADEPAADKAAPAPPANVAAKGYDQHVDVTWRHAPEKDLRHYKVYRSLEGGEFTPIAVHPGNFTRFVDFIGASGKTARYRVASVDTSWNESKPSNEVTASTREFTDDELLTMVQEACFRMYWEGAHPVSGLANEVLPGDRNLIALGGSGFGLTAIPVAVERGFITREQAVQHMLKVLRWLDKADRFKGVWPHFLDGNTGKTIAYFGPYDDGGDLVETAFLIQGLLTVRQYFTADNAQEKEIRETITRMWREVDWAWYRQKPNSDFLYWHWSPKHAFHISHPLVGWNETFIVYFLAIASPTHGVPGSMFHTGFAGQSETAIRYRQGWGGTTQGDHYVNGNTYHGIKLDVGVGSGAELFFTQFSFLGFDPRDKRDKYTNYFKNNRNIALIHHRYSIENPMKRKGYGDNAWGRSAGIHSGGGKPIPRDDNGTLTIHAAVASMPYTPDESMRALKHYYRDLGAKVWGMYGFHDTFNETENWFEPANMALNQAQMVVMIENHRTGLPWKLFMSNPEVEPALRAIGFQPDK